MHNPEAGTGNDNKKWAMMRDMRNMNNFYTGVTSNWGYPCFLDETFKVSREICIKKSVLKSF